TRDAVESDPRPQRDDRHGGRGDRDAGLPGLLQPPDDCRGTGGYRGPPHPGSTRPGDAGCLSLEGSSRTGVNKEALLSLLGSWLMRLVGMTLRFETDDRAGYFDPEREGQCLYAFWHNRIFAVPLYYERVCRREPPMVVLTSASRDGALLAAFVK